MKSNRSILPTATLAAMFSIESSAQAVLVAVYTDFDPFNTIQTLADSNYRVDAMTTWF